MFHTNTENSEKKNKIMEELDGVPCKVLGYPIKTRTQIYLSCLVTAILELLVYLIVVAADLGVTVQHFRDENSVYGSLTLMFLCLPAFACFCSIIVSPWQWPDDNNQCGKENVKFFLIQLCNLLFFPIGSTYRLTRRIFWSVEAIFHDRDTYERHHAVQKAAETSPFELYHFLQAFLQAAPQIILQFYILLRGNIFRNYETSHVQIISIVFSFITMAVVASTYQRFESQKVVGRNYPWTTEEQCTTRRKQFRQTKSVLEDPKPIEPIYVEIPGSEQIMHRFQSLSKHSFSSDEDEELNVTTRYNDHKSLHLGDFNLNKENNLSFSSQRKNIHFDVLDGQVDTTSRQSSKILNIPIGDSKLNRPTLLDLNAIVQDENQSNNDIEESNQVHLDFSPDHPPPPPPDLKHFILNQFNQLTTFKDMLVMNAEIYIKEHVPRLPENLFEHDDPHKPCEGTQQPDEVDFIMPTRKKTIEGIEQEDIVAKSVAFIAWTFFLVMRMVSISAFSVFFPLECMYLCLGHYLVMVACLFYETRFHEKIERTYFYLFLAYIYIFCILEFKIKFKRPRYWFVLYTTLMLLQNLAITFVWYYFAEFESWWFNYMFAVIILSFCYSLLCFLVFYFLLKPADKILLENND